MENKLLYRHFADDTTVFASDSDINNVQDLSEQGTGRSWNLAQDQQTFSERWSNFIYDNLQPEKTH